VPEPNRLTMRIEDLEGDEVRRLTEFSGIPGQNAERSRVVRGKSRKYAVEWSPELRRQFNAVAGSVMERYGYDLVPPQA